MECGNLRRKKKPWLNLRGVVRVINVSPTTLSSEIGKYQWIDLGWIDKQQKRLTGVTLCSAAVAGACDAVDLPAPFTPDYLTVWCIHTMDCSIFTKMYTTYYGSCGV